MDYPPCQNTYILHEIHPPHIFLFVCFFQYRSEDDILQAILDWVEYDVNDRRQHLKDLLPFVCFPYLSTQYLNDLRKHDLIGLRTEYACKYSFSPPLSVISFNIWIKKSRDI